MQLPTDFSVLLEWEGFAVNGADAAHLGLGFDRALEGLDRTPWGDREIAHCKSGRSSRSPGVESLFPSEADEFFRAERIGVSHATLDQSFSVLLVTEGRAALGGDGWEIEMGRGDAVLVPYGAGECALDGDAEVIRCMPPDPGAGS